jgi:hypothetical protein
MTIAYGYVAGRPTGLQVIEEVLEEAPVVDPLADAPTSTSEETPAE